MIEKRLTAILYGCDRGLWRGGPLQIAVSDVFASGGPRLLYRGETEESTLDMHLELPFDAAQLYGLTFSAPNHRPAWQFIRRADFLRPGGNGEDIEHDEALLRLMLVPDAPGTTDVPLGFERLRQSGSPFVAADTGFDAAAFAQLPVAAQMAFQNIEAKLRASYVDGRPLLSFVRAVSHVEVDRLFLRFDAGLKDRVRRAGDFAGAAGHGAPKAYPELPAHPDSWKHTRFAEGNVQLSFSTQAEPLPGGGNQLAHSADVDIDLGRGLAHAREWLENNVFRPGHKTDQTLVYGLLFAQGILPVYTLDPLPATTARAAPLRLSKVSTSAPGDAGRRPVRRNAPRPVRKKAPAPVGGKTRPAVAAGRRRLARRPRR